MTPVKQINVEIYYALLRKMPILLPYTVSYKPIASTGKNVLILHFSTKERMNDSLAPISNTYEGSLKQHRGT